MKPEEIDNLFRNRLSGLPVTPSADAWAQLQAKIKPPKKERTWWVYSAAASIIILMVSGLLLFQNYTPNGLTPTTPRSVKKPVIENVDKIASSQATNPPTAASDKNKSVQPADLNNPAPQPNLKTPNQLPLIAPEAKKLAANRRGQQNTKLNQPAKKLRSETTTMHDAKALVAQNLATRPTEEKNVMAAPPRPDLGVVQVVVKLDNADEVPAAYLVEEGFRDNLGRKGLLLKNLYKQARNLKNGEPVELATLGLDTEKINAEKENIKQKINKVISL